MENLLYSLAHYIQIMFWGIIPMLFIFGIVYKQIKKLIR